MIRYDGNETVSAYIQRVEKYKLEQDSKKYDLVLKFVNQLLELDETHKLKSLREFRRISEDNICKNKSKNFDLINKYTKKFKNKLGLVIKLNKNKKKTDSESETDDEVSQEVENDRDSIYTITVLQRVLRSIGYKLISNKFNSGRYYSIKN